MPRKKIATRDKSWLFSYDSFDPAQEKLREALTTVGNGYFGTRGWFEGERAGEHHYPGTSLAELYNRLPSIVHGKEIFNDDFVNCPNWLLIEYKIGNGKYVNLFKQEILEYNQTLDMYHGILYRTLRVKDKSGRITTVSSSRLASMANPHYAGIKYAFTPENYADTITIRSSIDGTIINDGVPRYRNLSNKHLDPVAEGAIDDGIFLTVETNQSHTQISMCAKHSLFQGKKMVSAGRQVVNRKGLVSELCEFEAQEGATYTFEKLLTISTSRDENTASAIDAARAMLSWAESYDAMAIEHCKAWEELWYTADVQIEGDPFAQTAIRLHTYHLLSTASQHNIHIDAGMPARGLHGEAYRGHIFWDSLFVLPFYFTRFPEVAKSALMYRYRRLDPARIYARENGYEGAMFPWQSADEGKEETQVIHFNPVSGKWDPDFSCRQRHVSIAIFYNIWEYFNHTGDHDFLEEYGAEMIIEIARFWSSIADFSAKDDRYHISGVMGPDEFHEKYVNSDKPGINDNAYTNIMVVWLLMRTIDTVKELSAESIDRLVHKINFNRKEMELWKEITKKMFVPVTDDGIICQYEGYMELKELNWEHYQSTYGNIHRMDRILKSEGDSPDAYKVSKQADALMAFYVLSAEEVVSILSRLGYTIKNKNEFLKNNYEFYERRTSHGSTLSKVVHAAISRDMFNQEGMWNWFMEALRSDIEDTQGGTTPEGIHSGVMAGTIGIITRVLAGIHFTSDGKIDINPALPPHWTRLAFKLVLRTIRYKFEFTRENISVAVDTQGENPLTIKINRDAFPS